MNEENLFHEITRHLLEDEKPSQYFTQLSRGPQMKKYPLNLLLKLKSTEQSPKYHPEGNAWNHTMLVVDEAAKVKKQSTEEKAFMWAALLHDIGKPDTTRKRKDKITSYDHDVVGAGLSSEFLSYFTEDEELIEKVHALVRYHMHILYVLKELPYGDIPHLLQEVDIEEIALLSKCDRLGRIGVDREAEELEYQQYIRKLQKAQAALYETVL